MKIYIVLGGKLYSIRSLESLTLKLYHCMHNRNIPKWENTQGRRNYICLQQSSPTCCGDRDTSQALHQEAGEKTKQEGYITSTDNTLPPKIIEHYSNSVYELHIVNNTGILSWKYHPEVEILEYHPEKLQQKQMFRVVLSIDKNLEQQEQPQDHLQK